MQVTGQRYPVIGRRYPAECRIAPGFLPTGGCRRVARRWLRWAGLLGQNDELHRAGELELRRPGRRPALSGLTGRIDVQCVLGTHVASPSVAQRDAAGLEAGSAGRDSRAAQKPPSTLIMSSTTSARFAKKAPAACQEVIARRSAGQAVDPPTEVRSTRPATRFSWWRCRGGGDRRGLKSPR